MSRITATDKLKEEDFPSQTWLGPMFQVLNKFIGEVVSIINGGLVFGENITGIERELTFKYASNALTFPQKTKWPFTKAPKAYTLVGAYETPSGSSESPIMVVCNFDFKQDSEGTFIHISDAVKLTSGGGATGLVAGSRYRFLIRVSP